MSASFDRFLNARQSVSHKASLGRAFSVVQQSWKLTDDPREVAPEVEVLATRRTASEAADIAREAAWSYKRCGFHKPSGAWWGADGETFYRFLVRSGAPGVRSGAIAAVALTSLASVAAFALMRRRAPARAR